MAGWTQELTGSTGVGFSNTPHIKKRDASALINANN